MHPSAPVLAPSAKPDAMAKRRGLLRASARASIALMASLPAAHAAVPAASAAPDPAPSQDYAPVVSGHALEFPADFGSHPDFRTEWWYVTGWLTTAHGTPLGFQVTFFRTKPAIDERNPSAFTPRQILIAHCALSDPALGRLRHDQRIRRAGMGLADAAQGDTRVWIDDWSLQRSAAGNRPAGSYRTDIVAQDFALHLTLTENQPVMPNGEAGFSRKGPEPLAASYYYSEPHLAVSGRISRGASAEAVKGEAWLDHEWSSEYLDEQAAGWDWIGINLDDGGALMAFQIRALDGKPRWAGATLRHGDGRVQILQPGDVRFAHAREWVSPRTGIRFPSAVSVHVGPDELALTPLIQDQENDARASTGAVYWEGAVTADRAGKTVGRGYLEMTGYGERLRLR
jgi:predicted secreted hydrolase